MYSKNKFHKLVSMLFIVATLVSNFQTLVVSAQGKDGLKRQVNAQSGKVSFIGPESGFALPASRALGTLIRPQDPALALAKRFAPEFGIKDAARELTEIRSSRPGGGRVIVRYQQQYQGIPVMGGELIVNTNERGDLYSMSGEVSAGLALPASRQPKIDSAQAAETARQALAKWYEKTPADFNVSEPELWIFDESLLKPSTRPVELVWRMEVTPKELGMPVRELVLVNAERGNISLHFNQVDMAWNGSQNEKAVRAFNSIHVEQAKTNYITEHMPALTGGVWYVAMTGNDSNDCATISTPCRTIQAAITKAASDSTIKAASGTYTSTTNSVANIYKSLTLSGGWDSTFTTQNGASIIDGEGVRNGIDANASYTFVTVDHFVIQNGAKGPFIGSGIYIYGANFTLKNSSVINNTAEYGAGIYMSHGTLTILNSTISGNTASLYGGGIFASQGDIGIYNSTIAYNSTNGTGGGIYRQAAIVNIRNSIIAKNTDSGSSPDCFGSISGASHHNIIGNTTGCPVSSGTGDKFNIDPLLNSSLSGTIPLHSLQAASPAIDAGDNNTCQTSDQRGMPRPVGNACDMGAYEYAPNGGLIALSGSGQATNIGSPFTLPLTVSVFDSSMNPVSGVTVTFSAPASGASGIFADSVTNTTTAITDENGNAVSAIFTANDQSGNYSVNATVSGVEATTIFHLTNNGTLYIATTGSDSNSCLTALLPCATINGAIGKAVAGDTIKLTTGTYNGTGAEVALIDKNITLSGGWDASFVTRSGQSTIDGQGTRRGVTLNSGLIVTTERITVQNGYNSVGAGLYNAGSTLTMNYSTINGNTGPGDSLNGGIYNMSGSTLTMNNSTVSNNGGAGIYSDGATITVTLNNSTISQNTSYGIFKFGGGALTIDNSTLSGNTGGGLYHSGSTATINNSTISGNSAANGGGIYTAVSPLTLKNTIVTGNSSTVSGPDCYIGINGSITSAGHNLIGNNSACTFVTGSGDLVGTSASPISAQLGPFLAAWGYYPLLPNSPAINAGDAATCLSTDQRGVPRPQGSACDIGAFEYRGNGTIAAYILSYSGSPQTVEINEPFPSALKAIILDENGDAVPGKIVTFTAPASGASAVFASTGTNISTAITDSDGIATSSVVSANGIEGAFTISATTPGVATSADFQITSYDTTVPKTILVVGGANQYAQTQTQFSLPLKAKVQNVLDQPMAGLTVTFTAPAGGASGTFAGTNTNTATAITDMNGIATSPAFSSNAIPGGYIIQAKVSGLASSADFSMTNGNPQASTYTANNTTSLPGTLLCTQTNPACTGGTNPHADAAHKYAIGTYELYLTKHKRNSLDNAGMTIISTVHYNSNYSNAFWDGSQVVYGDAGGWPLADDVVAHELTHGVTERESNLFYFYQSGAINESFSDLWGEYYDQTNGQGNEAAGVKWLIGEDISGIGAIRSMSQPPAHGDPDRMTSGYYYNGDGDNGGVHYNSGINNKAVYLMVDGGTFNGKTVAALGWDKTAAIYYEANTNLLTTGSNYSDLYYALQEACKDLTGQYGIVAGDCDQVKNALDAVEMSAPAYGGFYPAAPACGPGTAPAPLFQDDFESGTGNWDILGSGQWSWENWYATSGTHMMRGDDYYSSSDSLLTMKNGVYLAPGPSYYLHFRHAFLFEYDYSAYYDGGVLEYSTNNGATWSDAASLFWAGKNYNGTIYYSPGSSNALKGQTAFVGDSHGYVSSQYNLSSLVGQTVKFRWRFATDQFFYFMGWAVDDVQIYNCVPHISGNAGAAGVTLSYTDGTPRTVLSDADGDYSLPVSSGWSGTVTPSLAGVTFTPTSRSYTNVTSNQADQNYAASVTLSGNAGAAGATVNYTGGSTTANGSGNYSLTVPYGWTGTVTPSLASDAFCPASQAYNNLRTSKNLQNYAHAACPTFSTISKWTSSFDLSHGWTVSDFVRTVGDVSGDGQADLVGFGQDGVYVAVSNGTGFNPVSKWSSSFDLSHGWTVAQFVRTVGDVDGDGKADLVGFGQDGVYVAISNGTGFNPVSKWSSSFDLSHGWTVSQYVRTVGDVSGDGKADLIGFGLDGVYVAVSTGAGFGAVSKWTSAFDLSHGWTVAQYVRTVGDVNGDGKADIIGFGLDGVYVATSTGGAFGAISKWSSAFALANGWTVASYVRMVGDVNGDGKADIVGFGQDGVYIGLSTGSTFSLGSRRTTSFDLSHGWTVAQYVRTVGDVNGGGRADLVGFGLDGVYIATSQ